MAYSIAKNFDQYFKVHFVNSEELAKAVFKLRHDVYCEELGWEKTNAEQQEKDQYDDKAMHCLLEHRRTGKFAGCIRLVHPQANDIDSLPFISHYEKNQFNAFIPQYDLLKNQQLAVAEISRLAVTSEFRRRKNEKNVPFIINSSITATVFNEEEKRNFPNIAIGLYFSSIATASINNLSAVIAIMEPTLCKLMKRFGLHFEQIGEKVEHRGKRATYILPKSKFTSDLTPELLALYQLIYDDLAAQITQKNHQKSA